MRTSSEVKAELDAVMARKAELESEIPILQEKLNAMGKEHGLLLSGWNHKGKIDRLAQELIDAETFESDQKITVRATVTSRYSGERLVIPIKATAQTLAFRDWIKSSYDNSHINKIEHTATTSSDRGEFYITKTELERVRIALKESK